MSTSVSALPGGPAGPAGASVGAFAAAHAQPDSGGADFLGQLKTALKNLSSTATLPHLVGQLAQPGAAAPVAEGDSADAADSTPVDDTSAPLPEVLAALGFVLVPVAFQTPPVAVAATPEPLFSSDGAATQRPLASAATLATDTSGAAAAPIAGPEPTSDQGAVRDSLSASTAKPAPTSEAPTSDRQAQVTDVQLPPAAAKRPTTPVAASPGSAPTAPQASAAVLKTAAPEPLQTPTGTAAIAANATPPGGQLTNTAAALTDATNATTRTNPTAPNSPTAPPTTPEPTALPNVTDPAALAVVAQNAPLAAAPAQDHIPTPAPISDAPNPLVATQQHLSEGAFQHSGEGAFQHGNADDRHQQAAGKSAPIDDESAPRAMTGATDLAVSAAAAASSTNPLTVLPAEVRPAEVVSQIAHQADLYRLPGNRGVRIQLHPEGLGGVEVTMRYGVGGALQLHINVEHAETGALVQAGWTQLRDALLTQGISPERLVMSVTAPNGSTQLDFSSGGSGRGPQADADLAGFAQRQSGEQRQSNPDSNLTSPRGFDRAVERSASSDEGLRVASTTAATSRIDYRA